MVKLGTIKRIADIRMLTKQRDMRINPSTEAKNSSEEGGAVYLSSAGNPSERDTWLIDSGASCHMTPHREWFYEYQKYNGGYLYLGDDSPASIIGCGRVKLKLKDGRIRNFRGVLHIPNLARNLISIGKMDVSGVKTVCGDGGCKMV